MALPRRGAAGTGAATRPPAVRVSAGMGAALCAALVASGLAGYSLVAAMRAPSRGAAAAFGSSPRAKLLGGQQLVRVWKIGYRAFDGKWRSAFVVLPRWYGPRRHPPIPIVISPHGRGIEPQANAQRWGNLPAIGRFAVVNPEGQGRRLELQSWGAPGDIADLARMPQIVTRALPWLRIAPHRVYAVGSSMGGQSTLLLAAQYPHLLAGAAALDAPTNLAARYRAFGGMSHGRRLQRLARLEFGGTPVANRDGYADRSPLSYAGALARSGVPLEIWWSTCDRVVVHQAGESGLLYRTIKRFDPFAQVSEVVGSWPHSSEFRATRSLPLVLIRLGLLRGRWAGRGLSAALASLWQPNTGHGGSPLACLRRSRL